MATPDPTIGIFLQIVPPLAIIRIQNPKHHNAMTLDMWQSLPAVVAEADADPRVNVIIMRGAGDTAFVSGADISEFSTSRAGGAAARAYDKANSIAFASIRTCKKPTIAMIYGFCMGGGFGIAVACDLRYAADDAKFSIPAAKLGIGYPVDAMVDIVTTLGPAVAKELFYTARVIKAEEAFKLGILNAVSTKVDLETDVLKIANTVAVMAPLTIRAAKKAIAAVLLPNDRIIDDAYAAADACFDSNDYQEGVAAFLEKRNAKFRGR
ncbi:MAG: enoyl-CoA hydratase [Hyphomicrobiales bacterium]